MSVALPRPPFAANPSPEAAERERDFTRDASHELRTPLTVIRVASDLIAHDDGLSPASRRSLARIQDAVAGTGARVDGPLFLRPSPNAARAYAVLRFSYTLGRNADLSITFTDAAGQAFAFRERRPRSPLSLIHI